MFFTTSDDDSVEVIMAGPSHFSPELIGESSVRQKVVYANPLKLCSGNATKSKYLINKMILNFLVCFSTSKFE